MTQVFCSWLLSSAGLGIGLSAGEEEEEEKEEVVVLEEEEEELRLQDVTAFVVVVVLASDEVNAVGSDEVTAVKGVHWNRPEGSGTP